VEPWRTALWAALPRVLHAAPAAPAPASPSQGIGRDSPIAGIVLRRIKLYLASFRLVILLRSQLCLLGFLCGSFPPKSQGIEPEFYLLIHRCKLIFLHCLSPSSFVQAIVYFFFSIPRGSFLHFIQPPRMLAFLWSSAAGACPPKPCPRAARIIGSGPQTEHTLACLFFFPLSRESCVEVRVFPQEIWPDTFLNVGIGGGVVLIGK